MLTQDVDCGQIHEWYVDLSYTQCWQRMQIVASGYIQKSYFAHVNYVDQGCRLWPYPRKLCCPMLTHYVDRICWHRMQLVATSKAGMVEDKGWCWDNKMRLEVARRPDFAAVPTINYYQDPTPYLYILYRSRKDSLQCHYHPDNVRVSAYFCCRNTTENQNLKVNIMLTICLEKEDSLKFAQVLWTNWQ